MESDDTLEISLATWERSFRADAESDGNRILGAHLRSLKLPGKPKLLLEGTVVFVRACAAYLSLDNQTVEEFLSLQKYDPAIVLDATYLVTFDVHGKAFARIAVPKSFRQLDFADLYGTPWDRYKSVGYNQFWISRIDGTALTAEEISALDDVVTDDLRFDYEEDELEFWFDRENIEGALRVSIYDVESDV